MFYLVREVGKIWSCSCWQNGNFITVNEFKYGQTWKIWPSQLSLLLYSTFKQTISHKFCLSSTNFTWSTLEYFVLDISGVACSDYLFKKSFVMKSYDLWNLLDQTHLAITCSKLTTETLEQGMKYDQS